MGFLWWSSWAVWFSYHNCRTTDKQDAFEATLTDILSAFNKLDEEDKLSSFYCEATHLINLPCLEPDTVSKRLDSSYFLPCWENWQLFLPLWQCPKFAWLLYLMASCPTSLLLCLLFQSYFPIRSLILQYLTPHGNLVLRPVQVIFSTILWSLR